MSTRGAERLTLRNGMSQLYGYIFCMLVSNTLTGMPLFGGALYLCGKLILVYGQIFRRNRRKYLPPYARKWGWVLAAMTALITVLLTGLYPASFESASLWVVFAMAALNLAVEAVSRLGSRIGNRLNGRSLTALILIQILLSGAAVLGDKRRQCHGESSHREEHKSLQLHACADAGHGVAAETVDVGLDEHVGQVDHASLHGRGKTVPDNISQAFMVHSDPAGLNPDAVAASEELCSDEHHAQDLRQDRRQCRPFHVHMEDGDEQDIQDNIGQGTGDQADERETAFSGSLQNADKHVVHDQGGCTGEIDLQISAGPVKHRVRCPHQAQDWRGDQNAEGGHQDAEQCAERNGGMHRLFCGLRMIGPDMPGNDDPGSGREPRHKTDHQVGIGSGGGDRGQGVSVEIVAHDQGIHGIVQLLKEIACKNRQGKSKHFSTDVPFRHQGVVLLHRSSDCRAPNVRSRTSL